MNKLIVCIMGQNCERFIEMCLESVKEADAIIYCDGGSTDNTLDIVKNKISKYIIFDKEDYWQEYFESCERCGKRCGSGVELIKNKNVDDTIHLCNECFGWDLNGKNKIIYNEYNQEDLGMNGKQRNFYLNYLKENKPEDWALCLDADEVVEDLSQIKKAIQYFRPGLYSVRMRHLIGDLAHEDSITEKHWVLNRLFKINCADSYPEVEHPVLQGKNGVELYQTDYTTIWHLAYIPGMWDIKKRYDNHVKKSNMHTPEFLKQWYHMHLFGNYPKKQFNPAELPKVILNKFGINKDELYFSNRGIDMKHPLMVKQWYEYFKPNSVLDLGCGRGPYLYFWNWFVNDIKGIDLSQWAVDNSFVPNRIRQGDITDEKIFNNTGFEFVESDKWELITAIDVLEHLDDTQLDKALRNISKYGKKFLFSIPFEGDPNLLLDNTHKQFHTKEWWINKIESFNIKIKETPIHWLFKEQILIGSNDLQKT